MKNKNRFDDKMKTEMYSGITEEEMREILPTQKKKMKKKKCFSTVVFS